MRNLSRKWIFCIALAVLLMLFGGFVAYEAIHMRNKIDLLNAQLATNIARAEFDKQRILSDLDTNQHLLSLAVLAQPNRLYLPELGVVLPLNSITRSAQYYVDTATSETEPNIRISSTLAPDHKIRTQSCTDMVRLKVEDTPNAYSPSQPHYATVKLSDGRILQIYASVKPEECKQAWATVSPEQLAMEFARATVL